MGSILVRAEVLKEAHAQNLCCAAVPSSAAGPRGQKAWV